MAGRVSALAIADASGTSITAPVADPWLEHLPEDEGRQQLQQDLLKRRHRKSAAARCRKQKADEKRRQDHEHTHGREIDMFA